MFFPFPKIGAVIEKQFPLTGEWLPGADPAVIGAENFSVLENQEYTDDGLQGVPGYSKINTTALTTNVKGRAGVHLRTPHTMTSSVVVEVEDSSGNGVIKENRTAVPDQGDFEATALFTETSGAGQTRFSLAPRAQIAMANGQDTCIWGGPEVPIAAFFLLDDLTLDGTEAPQDHTDKLLNTLQDANNVVTIDAAGHGSCMVLTTRPAKAIKFYIKTANGTASTISASNVFTGASGRVDSAGWAALSGTSDGTTVGAIAMAQTGSFSFATTVSSAVKFHYQGLYLYAYTFTLSAGSAVIYHVTADCPFQQMVDVWDGVFREPVGFFASLGGTEKDFSAEVLVDSDVSVPIGAEIDGMTNTDEIIAVFEEQMAGLRIEFLEGKVNANAGITLTLGFWNGANYTSNTKTVSGGTLADGMTVGGTTFKKSETVTWVPVAVTTESRKTERGVKGWCYRITVSGAISADVIIDRVYGIPASLPVRPYAFTALYKNWLMLGAPTVLKEPNRMDFCVSNAPDSRNGDNSSANGARALYFGGGDALVGADQFYQRFASNVVSLLAVFKKGEMHILQGDSVEDLRVYPVSFNVGCPAPLTISVAEVGFEMASNVNRNIMLWISNGGPMMFDAAVLYRIKGIEIFFDRDRPECVNFDYIHLCHAKFDPTRSQWNVWLVSGSGQTEINVWLVFDLLRKKWFRKNPGQARMPQCAISAMATTGDQYLYGMIDSGYLLNLVNGTSWDGHGIRQRRATGDFWPTGNVWDQTRLVQAKEIAHRTNETATLSVTHFANTLARSGSIFNWDDTYFTWDDTYFTWQDGAASDADISLGSGNNRLVMATKKLNKAGNAHRLEWEVATSDTVKGYRPIEWGYSYVVERKNLQSF